MATEYWATFPTPDEAQDDDRAMYSSAALERGIISVAVRLVAAQFSGTDSKIDALPNDIKRAQVLGPNGARISLLAWSSAGPISAFCRTLIVDDARESLCICVVPSRDADVDVIADRCFILYPRDIDALAAGEINGWDLLDYKSVRRFQHGRRALETEYAAVPATELRSASRDLTDYFVDAQTAIQGHEEWIDHPLRDELDAAVRRGRWSLLVGTSSSGKTFLALQSAYYLRLAGYNLRWTNVTTHGEPPPNLLSALVHDANLRASVFVIDDLQSSPGAARYVISVLRLLQRASTGKPPVVIGISWPSFARDVLQYDGDWLPLSVNATVIREALLLKFHAITALTDVANVIDLLGDDLLLVRLFLERSAAAGRAVTADELAQHVIERRTTDAQRKTRAAAKAIITTGALGQFDIAPSERFVTAVAGLTTAEVNGLAQSGLLRRQSDTITLGHRSLSGLLADWAAADGAWEALPPEAPHTASDLVLAYLRSLESPRALDTLIALAARAQFRERQKLNPQAALIVEIWHAFLAVLERIERQQRMDPTWGGDPSSAMFAAQALARVGKTETALLSVEFLRKHWRIEDDNVAIDLDVFSTQRDFHKIIDAMRDEDIAIGQPKFPFATIDRDRFHRTWLAGVILCSEGASELVSLATQRLVAATEREAEEHGNFYPARVPWCSARVLLGLASLGRTIHNSSAVQRCVEWLLRDERNDGARHAGIWRGGTGIWNSPLETTSLVLLALKSVGYDTSTERLAHQFLLDERPRWTALGEELDGAVALHAYLETGGNFPDIADSARELSVWARGEALWQSATDRSDFVQSCRVAQIAAHLVNIGWTAVRTNLTAFLEALEPRTPFRVSIAPASIQAPTKVTTALTPPLPQPQLVTPADRIATALADISAIDLAEFTVIGGYRRHDERIRHQLRDRVEHMRRALSTKTLVRENFLVWAAPGSGKSFLIEELARVLGDTISYHEINLAKMSRADVAAAVAALSTTKPVLCLLDEFDARESEPWPYEDVFPFLDWNTRPDRHALFVVVGSCPNGLHSLERLIESRRKGKDLLDRVPIETRFEIPATTIEDKITIIASKLAEASGSRGQVIEHIEKLAVYYAIAIPELQTPRQLRDLVLAAVTRTHADETRLRYDHLFQRGDQRNQRFWSDHLDIVDALAERFIRVTDSS